MSETTLPYADPTTDARGPTAMKHSRFATVAIAIYSWVAIGKLAVWGYGCYRWHPAFRDDRLHYRVVEPYGLLTIAEWMYAIGAVLGLIAILRPSQKRSLAVFAFSLNFVTFLYLYNEMNWGFFFSRY